MHRTCVPQCSPDRRRAATFEAIAKQAPGDSF